MKIQALKEQARVHERKEEWKKALDAYLKAIKRMADADEEHPDIGLYNRVGDLHTRLGNIEAAVEHYERAADLYLEADLPNNAIAVCKKVLRNLPGRPSIVLKMGQVRAQQGFLVDARENFLKYAELQQQVGNMDEAFRALVEFADLAPEEVEIRLTVAKQLEASERIEEAVSQYIRAHQQYTVQGRDREAMAVGRRIEELAPGTEIPEPESPDAGAASSYGRFLNELPGFEPTSYGGRPKEAGVAGEGATQDQAPSVEEEEEEEEEPFEPLHRVDVSLEEEEEKEKASASDLPFIDLERELKEEEGKEEKAEPPILEIERAEEPEAEPPTLEVGGEEDREEEVVDLPFMEVGDEEPEGEQAPPTFEVETDEGAAPEPEAGPPFQVDQPPPAEADHEALAETGEWAEAVSVLRQQLRRSPDDLDLHQRVVEYAHRSGDRELLVSAFLELGSSLRRIDQPAKARAVFEQVLALEPENAGARAALQGLTAATRSTGEAGYVDLGSMVLDQEEPSGETRWIVPAREPSGDEEADFALMLTQFKQKVAENVAQDDLRSHHDLGTAYKEMGLVDEAIAEFQQALRAEPHHLPTYELLGQCFMERGDYEVAVRSLSRAVSVPTAVEDELIGIFYYLGLAHQQAGNTQKAREFYEKVFTLDINFRDVTERLRDLR